MLKIYSIQYEMRSIREHLKEISNNSEQTRILIHVFLSFIFVKILNRSAAMLFANAQGGLIAMSRCPALIKEKIL